jgi:hypothetical protein
VATQEDFEDGGIHEADHAGVGLRLDLGVLNDDRVGFGAFHGAGSCNKVVIKLQLEFDCHDGQFDLCTEME